MGRNSQTSEISGIAKKADKSISDEYFSTRPRGGQLSAWAQSKLNYQNREEVTNKIAELDKKFENQEVPRPDFWGGFEIEINYWEFWQGRRNRTHDRFCYTQNTRVGISKGCLHNERIKVTKISLIQQKILCCTSLETRKY